MHLDPRIIAAILLSAGACRVPGQSITAAGATFPAPLYQRWFSEYKASHPSVQINYQLLGSGGGIKQLQAGTIDFGASDMPMTDEQMRETGIRPLHFPTVLGGVVIVYNIPGTAAGLKLSPESIAGIFLGSIRSWDDGRIAADNPGAHLPRHPIVVIHRSDGSGTSFVFTDYLSKVSAEWKRRVGVNTSVSWPTGVGQKGSDGVAGLVKQTPYSVGYVELSFAVNNRMAFADVRNSAGNFVRATLESVTAAAAEARELPEDFRASITNGGGADSYPISTFTWILIPERFDDPQKKSAVVEFMTWMLKEGQTDARPLRYSPLPKELAEKELKQLAQIR